MGGGNFKPAKKDTQREQAMSSADADAHKSDHLFIKSNEVSEAVKLKIFTTKYYEFDLNQV